MLFPSQFSHVAVPLGSMPNLATSVKTSSVVLTGCQVRGHVSLPIPYLDHDQPPSPPPPSLTCPPFRGVVGQVWADREKDLMRFWAEDPDVVRKAVTEFNNDIKVSGSHRKREGGSWCTQERQGRWWVGPAVWGCRLTRLPAYLLMQEWELTHAIVSFESWIFPLLIGKGGGR